MGHQCRLAWWEEGRERTRELSYKSCIPNDCRTGFQYSFTEEMLSTGNCARLGDRNICQFLCTFQLVSISGKFFSGKIDRDIKLTTRQSKRQARLEVLETKRAS